MKIIINARLWFRRTYGESRHSVTITNDAGETLRQTDNWNGKWEKTAAQMIEEAGWLPPRRTVAFGVKIGLERWATENGSTIETHVERVTRKGDM